MKGADPTRRKHPLDQWDDEQLIAHYRQTGDQQAVAVLLHRYADLITVRSARYLRDPEEMKDFAMDLYLKLLEKLQHHEVENFKGWLPRMVTNQLLDITRKKKVRHQHREMVMAGPAPVEEIDHRLSVEMDLQLLHDALARLSEKERLVVEWLYFEQMSYEEAVDHSGWTMNQVRGTRDRAIAKLRQWLGPSLGQYFTDP